jgi:hypothetical protein
MHAARIVLFVVPAEIEQTKHRKDGFALRDFDSAFHCLLKVSFTLGELPHC